MIGGTLILVAVLFTALFAIGIPGDISTFVKTAVNNIIGFGRGLQGQQHRLTGDLGSGWPPAVSAAGAGAGPGLTAGRRGCGCDRHVRDASGEPPGE